MNESVTNIANDPMHLLANVLAFGLLEVGSKSLILCATSTNC